MRMPIHQGLAGRVEQGVFLPTHTASNPCTGKVFTVEMHHQRVDVANPGDNVGLNIKGLDKNNMPVPAMSWCTRRTPPLDRPGSSMPRSRSWTSPTRSRWATPPSASRAAGVLPAVSPPEVEDGKGDGRQEDGGPQPPEVQRDGSVQLPAPAASRVRHLQELRGSVSGCCHGWQRRRDAWKGGEPRAKG